MSCHQHHLEGTLGAAVVRGYSAYETAVRNGYTGTESEWLATLKGVQGDKGDTGDSGVHIGTDAPTDPVKTVWIDTDGEADDFDGAFTAHFEHGAGNTVLCDKTYAEILAAVEDGKSVVGYFNSMWATANVAKVTISNATNVVFTFLVEPSGVSDYIGVFYVHVAENGITMSSPNKLYYNASVLVANITFATGGGYQCDKTYLEIVNAMSGGKTVIGNLIGRGETAIVQKIDFNNVQSILFHFMVMPNDTDYSYISVVDVIIGSNNAVTMKQEKRLYFDDGLDVTITFHEPEPGSQSYGYFTADKTYDEVLAALNAGKKVVGHYASMHLDSTSVEKIPYTVNNEVVIYIYYNFVHFTETQMAIYQFVDRGTAGFAMLTTKEINFTA